MFDFLEKRREHPPLPGEFSAISWIHHGEIGLFTGQLNTELLDERGVCLRGGNSIYPGFLAGVLP